jgi:ABC-type Mn2+/Zn2+ transport system permease subunit
MDTDRQKWNAALKLAVLISVVAAFAAVAISAAGDIPQTAIVLPVIIVAFTASWVQTGRARRQELPVHIAQRHNRAAPTA